MAYDIGPRVGVTGEKEFNRQMREINDTIKLLGSQMMIMLILLNTCQNVMIF